MNIDINNVKTSVAIEAMTDLHQLQLSRPGDIVFIISKQNTDNRNDDTCIEKCLHSTILIARSTWFRKVYKQYLKKTDESNFQLNEITQSAYKDKNRRLCFDMQTVELKVFREFGKKY
jgi:hypothetical protein